MALGQLPEILAGPILRRADPDGIYLWIATSVAHAITAEVYDTKSMKVLGRSKPASYVALSPRLFVCLVRVPPTPGTTYERGKIHGYRMFLTGKLLPTLGKLAYDGFDTPTFVLQRDNELRLIHASCRKLHGPGVDGITLIDAELRRTAHDSERPTTLCLTGDQIYADDVAEPLVDPIHAIARLLGFGEEVLPDGTNVRDRRCGKGNERLRSPDLHTKDAGALTSTEMRNQAVGFGQYVALYLLAWNPEIWTVQPVSNTPPCRAFDIMEYANQLIALQDGRVGTRSARRVLANISTYMIMDDHEITDDWNIDNLWLDRARDNPMTVRLITNGLAAFAVFQGWGNDPASFEPTVKGVPKVLARRVPHDEKALRDIDWTFTTPEDVLVVDTRTQRGRGIVGKGNPNLYTASLRSDVAMFTLGVRLAGLVRRSPAVIVLPAPVFGPAAIEALQKLSASVQGKYSKDVETWESTNSLAPLLNALETTGVSRVIALSGDVHHAYVTRHDVKALRFLQFTSSALKNDAGSVMKKLMASVVAGDKDPTMAKVALVAAAGLVEPMPAALLYAWVVKCRQFIEGPDMEPKRAWISGENNIGLLTIADGEVDLTLQTVGGDTIDYTYNNDLQRRAPSTSQRGIQIERRSPRLKRR